MSQLKIFLCPCQGLSLLGLRNMGIIQSETLYLSSNVGPIAFIKIERRQDVGIPRCPDIGTDGDDKGLHAITQLKPQPDKKQPLSLLKLAPPEAKFDSHA